MKKYLITLLSGVLALVSCYKEEIPAIMDKGGLQAPRLPAIRPRRFRAWIRAGGL